MSRTASRWLWPTLILTLSACQLFEDTGGQQSANAIPDQPGELERGWGRIIIVSSVAGLRGFQYISAYSASKHAVMGLMKCAAMEVMTKGVTVNAICPGYVLTPIVQDNIRKIAARSGMTEEEAQATLRDENPFGRLITPEEVAEAALWLCGPHSGAVTGQAIPVSGGPV